ncbi:lipoyl(octanoyl) transferase LipB [uncultured Anaeromusa sp.]|uniref:lipoyl(octanoyl) transferase LipB n=1 Tax=uncultured Anaeromusa sp. TaxID=673273 RepID=UPI0029C709A3|nr:lipoyl(octanoyl) transferase LipB [uncultured Anaeromusa sp.]
MRQEWTLCDLGCVEYHAAWDLQERMQQERRRNERSDMLLVVRHPPVFTIGRAGSRRHILASEEVLATEGIRVWEVDRGGDVTYHGPGQIVVYPILDLRQYGQDLHAYVRSLEEALIRTVGVFGVPARREPGLTGVWTDKGKIAAIGIGVKGWVSMHGIALNVRPNMNHFRMIVPCGISGRPVDWLAQWQDSVVEEEVQDCLLQNLADVLDATYEEEVFHETAAAGMAKDQGA